MEKKFTISESNKYLLSTFKTLKIENKYIVVDKNNNVVVKDKNQIVSDDICEFLFSCDMTFKAPFKGYDLNIHSNNWKWGVIAPDDKYEHLIFVEETFKQLPIIVKRANNIISWYNRDFIGRGNYSPYENNNIYDIVCWSKEAKDYAKSDYKLPKDCSANYAISKCMSVGVNCVKFLYYDEKINQLKLIDSIPISEYQYMIEIYNEYIKHTSIYLNNTDWYEDEQKISKFEIKNIELKRNYLKLEYPNFMNPLHIMQYTKEQDFNKIC